MINLRLRRIVTVNFSRNELTNYLLLCKKHPELKRLEKDDVICMRSLSGDQCIFVHGFQGVVGASGRPVACLPSRRLRLIDLNPNEPGSAIGGGRPQWDDLMIADYAHKVGIKLIGLKLWKEYFADLLDRLKEDRHYAD